MLRVLLGSITTALHLRGALTTNGKFDVATTAGNLISKEFVLCMEHPELVSKIKTVRVL